MIEEKKYPQFEDLIIHRGWSMYVDRDTFRGSSFEKDGKQRSYQFVYLSHIEDGRVFYQFKPIHLCWETGPGTGMCETFIYAFSIPVTERKTFNQIEKAFTLRKYIKQAYNSKTL